MAYQQLLSKISGKPDNFNFKIANFLFLDEDVRRFLLGGIYFAADPFFVSIFFDYFNKPPFYLVLSITIAIPVVTSKI